MKKIDESQFIWSQKYRPQTIEDCILPESIKKTFVNLIKKGSFQSLLLSGGAGIGKSTTAIALCKDLGFDYLFINASDENGIDVLRTKIKQFASTVGINQEGGHKVVICDESDMLSPQFQGALRATQETYSKNCSFILTCNYKNRIIEPIHSRCTGIDFGPSEFRNPVILKQMMDRLCFILDNEEVKYEKPVIAELIMKWAPDFRRIINETQKYSVQNDSVLDQGVLVSDHSLMEIGIKDLLAQMKKKDFKAIRQWIVNNSDIDSSQIYRKIYDALSTGIVSPASIPQIILILAEYQYRDAFVVDHEINMMASFIEIVSKSEFL